MSDTHDGTTTRRFSREVLDLFDGFVHGDISRRGFIERCALLVGGVSAAAAVLEALSPDFASAQLVPTDDTRIRLSRVDIPSPGGSGSIRAYVASPAGASPRARKPVVLVIHENRGLNPHIEDIARRLAVDGFITVAPDALTKVGGYPGDEDKARVLFQTLDQAKITEDFMSTARWALKRPDGNGKLGAVGFCYGGGAVNMLATRVLELRAAVPFYGSPPVLDSVSRIKAELLVNMAGNDARINGMWPAYKAALDKAGVRYQGYIYPGVEHGFNNNTTPRFNAEAAGLAWSRTLALFRKQLA